VGWPRKKGKRRDIPDVRERPGCVQCGRTLLLHTEWRYVSPSQPAPKRLVSWQEDDEGMRWCRVWTGRFGWKGDDRFCCQKCGWEWAVEHAPAANTKRRK